MAVTPPTFRTDRAAIFDWAERGAIPLARLREALAVTGVTPTARDWLLFLEALLLWCGAAALGAGLVFFIAFNWTALGRYTKFGLVEAVVVLAVVAAWRLGIDRVAGKAALLVASLATGGLLALFGQTYQTGADTFELFASWAALILPWILVARFAALWMLWIAIVNLAVGLYFQIFPAFLGLVMTTERQVWALFTLNTAAWAAWQLLARRVAWLDERWAIWLLAMASAALITGLASAAMLGTGIQILTVLGYVVWLAAVYVVYRRRVPDLFVIAIACLSAIVAVTVLMSRALVRGGGWDGALLVIALAVIGMTVAAAGWLRRIAAEPVR